MENLKHNTINEITDFNKTLNTYNYGYIVDGKPLIEPDDYSKYSFYIQCNTTNHVEPTHTWLGFEYNGKVYSFESSWQSEQGIREFDSVKAMLKYYKKAQLIFVSKQNMHCTGYTIREFKQPAKFNLGPEEYMQYCLTHGKVLMEENFKFPCHFLFK